MTVAGRTAARWVSDPSLAPSARHPPAAGEAGRRAALRFARACADIARVRPVPSFQWAAAGLAVEVPGAGTGLVRVRDNGDRNETELCPDGRDASLAATGAAAALVASALTGSVGGRDDPRWTCSVSAVIGAAGPVRHPDGEWLGYMPVREGWIGLVLPGRDAHETWTAAVRTLGVRQMPPLAAAALMQHLGIAAFPARPPRTAWPPATGTARQPGAEQPATWPAVLQPADSVMVPAVCGRRVADLGRVVAAPFAAQILEDLGAHVRHVRPPDPAAGLPDRNVIDLSDPAGAKEIAALAAAADLVIENFRPRGWDIVQAAISSPPRRRAAIRGFDADSPLRNWKMYGFLVEGFFGIGSRPCDQDGRAAGGATWDRLCGVVAAAASIQQLSDDTRMAAVSEVSQVGLARMWVNARRAEVSNWDEERLSR